MFNSIKTFFRLCKGHGYFVMAKYVLRRSLYFIQKKIMRQRYIVRKIHNYKMLLDLYDNGISRTLNFFGGRELDQKLILEKEN